MTGEGLGFRNGQCQDRRRIPVLGERAFRDQILKECQADARLVNLFGLLDADGDILVVAVLGYDERSTLSFFSMKIPKAKAAFDSLTPDLLQAHLFEREIAEQYAVRPIGHPWLRPLRYHGNYRNVPDLWPGDTLFFEVEGEGVHEVAVGPIHAGVIEPGHFRFQCHGEEVLNLEIQLGYQHRGIERLMQESSPTRSVLLAESIAGDTVIGHALAYCELMEALSSCQISARAQVLRLIALELERLSNHVGDLGALAADTGFLPASAYFGRMRGEFLNILMELTGNRYGRSFCRPGGVLFDLDEKMAGGFGGRLAKTQKEFKQVSELFFGRPSVLSRLEGVGTVSRQTAQAWGLVGPSARAAGLNRDVRTDYPHGAYRFHHIPISLADTGDVHGRALVRWLETQRSFEFLRTLLRQLPSGGLVTEPGPLQPHAVAVSLVEGWRGEIVHIAMTGPDSRMSRYKIKDPSFNNWMGVSLAVKGGLISDFPLCNKSFNLSYAGHDL